jgi:3-methyladenine DNA glycosylase/8-oxoguanine DNA glycosylase
MMRIDTPPDFDFAATVGSHGWCVLAPLAWDAGAGALETPLRLPGGRVTRVRLDQRGGRGAPVRVAAVAGAGSRSGLSETDRRAAERALGRMLRLDQDLAAFHLRCRGAGAPFERAPADGFGRLLRSATVFEDLAKILATTNTAWSGTKAMVARLVEVAGRGGAFPTPAEVAAVGAERLRSEARWGYRAPSLAAIAGAIDSGTVDPAAWEAWEGSTEDLEEEIRRLPGFGPYATAHALALLGRFDRIGVDTVFREFVRRRHFPKSRKVPADRRMLAVYERWGEWRMLAYWYELWVDYDGRGL